MNFFLVHKDLSDPKNGDTSISILCRSFFGTGEVNTVSQDKTSSLRSTEHKIVNTVVSFSKLIALPISCVAVCTFFSKNSENMLICCCRSKITSKKSHRALIIKGKISTMLLIITYQLILLVSESKLRLLI